MDKNNQSKSCSLNGEQESWPLSYDLSIIIPCRAGHQDDRIVAMVEETKRACPNTQIIISSDRYSKGKGWALREGLKHATGQAICFIDGDGDIDPGWIPEFYDLLRYCDIVVARKSVAASKLWSRRIITACSRAFISGLFGLRCDTQTGLKMFRKKYLLGWEDDGFAFDIEILSKATMAGARIAEVKIPVDIRKQMPTRSIIRFIMGALKIRIRLWVHQAKALTKFISNELNRPKKMAQQS